MSSMELNHRICKPFSIAYCCFGLTKELNYLHLNLICLNISWKKQNDWINVASRKRSFSGKNFKKICIFEKKQGGPLQILQMIQIVSKRTKKVNKQRAFINMNKYQNTQTKQEISWFIFYKTRKIEKILKFATNQ